MGSEVTATIMRPAMTKVATIRSGLSVMPAASSSWKRMARVCMGCNINPEFQRVNQQSPQAASSLWFARLLALAGRFEPSSPEALDREARFRDVARPASVASCVVHSSVESHDLNDDFTDAAHGACVFGAEVDEGERCVAVRHHVKHRICAVFNQHVRFLLAAVPEDFEAFWRRDEFVDEVENDAVGATSADDVGEAEDPGAETKGAPYAPMSPSPAACWPRTARWECKDRGLLGSARGAPSP